MVWEMSESGDWVLPRVNGEQIPSKPPLYHWTAATFAGLLGGVSERAVRLPSILSASLAIGLVFAAAAVEWGVVVAVIAAVTLATSPEWVKWATTARTDATFAFFLTAAFLLGHRWLRSGKPAALFLLAAATGAATLAKGFAGAALVGLVVAIESWRGAAWRGWRAGSLLLAAVIFCAVAGSWYAAALMRGGGAFFEKQIVLENVLRFFPYEGGGPSRRHSVLFYVPTLFTGMLPWSIALPHALLRGARERRPGADGGGFSGYLLSWFSVVFVVCTAASGKRSNYLLPLYPAAALLIGRQLAAVLEQAGSSSAERALRASGLAAAALCAAVGAVLVSWRLGFEPWTPVLRWLHPQDRVLLPQMTAAIGRPGIPLILLAAGFSVALLAATELRAWRDLYGLIGGFMLLVTVAGCLWVSQLESALKSFQPFTERVSARVGSDPVTFLGAADYAVLFYLKRHVPVGREGIQAIARPGWALVWKKDWDALSAAEREASEIAEESPPASVGRPDTRLLLVSLPARRGASP